VAKLMLIVNSLPLWILTVDKDDDKSGQVTLFRPFAMTMHYPHASVIMQMRIVMQMRILMQMRIVMQNENIINANENNY
jgi:hypothetical protein